MPAPGPFEPTKLVPIPTSNGTLHGEAYLPAGAPKGIVVVTHGYAEHCGRYRELGHVIAQAGWAALTYDVRGHGKAPGNRGFVASFHEYVDDLRAVSGVARGLVAAPAPLVLLGHSHGSLITLRAACEGIADAKALIVSSPSLALRMKVPGWKKVLARVASRIAPKLPQPNGIKADQLTHDKQMQIAHDADPLNFPVATARWFVESTSAQDYVAANAARITLPSTRKTTRSIAPRRSISSRERSSQWRESTAKEPRYWRDQTDALYSPQGVVEREGSNLVQRPA